MVWDIGLIQIFNSPQLRQWRYRLLLSYLIVTGFVLAAFAIMVYTIVARDRHNQLDLHVRQLAMVAAVSLETVQHEYEELFTEAEYAEYITRQGLKPNTSLSLSELMGKYQQDGLVAPNANQVRIANPLTPENQGVEWFDQQKRLLVREGSIFPDLPLPPSSPEGGDWYRWQDLRIFLMPVILTNAEKNVILGYVRASESTLPLAAELQQLREQLILGVVLVSGLVTLGGIWLTSQSLSPVLANLEQLKQFTANASHELRNPLTAIRASVAVLQSHPERINAMDWDKLQAIASASGQMSQLVDDLLLLTRLDRHTLDARLWRSLPLDELLEDLGFIYGDRAAAADLTLTLDLQAEAIIQGDAAQLQRLFTNLLSNALQYTPPGGYITLTLKIQENQAWVNIQDTGIGIAPEHIPHIFDRFWRADPARHYDPGGTGLGLAIAQSIAHHHHGSISLTSQLDIGSCFQVKLPLDRK